MLVHHAPCTADPVTVGFVAPGGSNCIPQKQLHRKGSIMQESVFPSSFSGRLRQFTFLAGLCLAVLILCQLPVSAQNATGAISGTVTDSSNAVVPDAAVVLKDEAQQTVRQSVSNGSGYFNFQAVKPGTYTLTVSASGFTTWEERSIPFSQGASITIPNIVLQVGGTKSEVAVVAANDVIVPTDTGQTSTTLNQHMITQLSLAGRDAAELIKIMPGMGSTTGLSNKPGFDPTTGTANNTGPIGQYSAKGTQPNGGMTMTSDGANLLDPGQPGNPDRQHQPEPDAGSLAAHLRLRRRIRQRPGHLPGDRQERRRAVPWPSGYFYARNGVFERRVVPTLRARACKAPTRQLLLSGRRLRRTGPDSGHPVQQEPRQVVLLWRLRVDGAAAGRLAAELFRADVRKCCNGNFTPGLSGQLWFRLREEQLGRPPAITTPPATPVRAGQVA